MKDKPGLGIIVRVSCDAPGYPVTLELEREDGKIMLADMPPVTARDIAQNLREMADYSEGVDHKWKTTS